MATLTVAGVEEALSKYKTVGSSFIQELNLVMPRLYAMGMWRDLLYETTISTTDGNFTLPDDSESIVSAMVDDDPVRAKAQFHDYRITGRNRDGSTLYGYGLVDDGFAPAVNELEASKAYTINIEPVPPATEIPRTSTNFITITGLNNASTPSMQTYTPNLDTAVSGSGIGSGSVQFTSITEIRNGDSSLSTPVKITAVNVADATDKLELGTVQEANKINSFRRYRLGNDISNATKKTIRVLVKRKFKNLINSFDVVRPSNLNAIKHGLLGTVAEDNADLERANYHWNVCKQLLEEELDAYRGSAKPAVNFDPTGSGSRIPNVM